MLGVVNLDKPVGPTSHDMVGLLRRLTGMRRIGHAGTLDPLASGVLPILVGGATRFSEELTGGRKRYDATIRLGERSATDDGQGPLTAAGSPIPDDGAIAVAAASFAGTITQRPPAFSARKVGGATGYRAARAGAPLDLPPRQVTIDALDIRGIERHGALADVRIDLRCGPGTYVRSVARDLGELLGCGGHLHALRRTEAAGLRALDAFTPDRLEALAGEGRLAEALIDVGALLPLPRVELDAERARLFRNGAPMRDETAAEAGRHAVYAGGALIGIGVVQHGMLLPDKVLAVETTVP
jgi:tRNA pseudouridine55 synthase